MIAFAGRPIREKATLNGLNNDEVQSLTTLCVEFERRGCLMSITAIDIS